MARLNALAVLAAAAMAASGTYAFAQLGGAPPKAQTDLFKTDPEGFTRNP